MKPRLIPTRRIGALFMVCTTMLLIFSTGPSRAADKVTNTGQDPTNPVTRFDIRWTEDLLPFDKNFDTRSEADTFIVRADAPIPLGKKGSQGTLAFRVDIPFSSVQNNVPGEDGTFELGSVYLQFLHVVPKKWGNLPKSDAWGWGYAAQMPTATNGRKDRTDIFVFGARWPMKFSNNAKVRKGTFAVPVLKYYNGPAEVENGFDAIDELELLPTINFAIPTGIDFITLWGNYGWVYNFEDGVARPEQKSGDYFIPYDVTFGKMLSGGKVVLSGTFAGDLTASDGFKKFDDRFMLRLGFFF